MTCDYDVAVIGGGPGGYVAAIRCAQYGKNVVLIEEEHLGGTCLNKGCIPTKVMVKSAEVYEELCDSEKFGIIASGIQPDFEKIALRRDNISLNLRNGIEGLLKKNKITLVRATGTLTDSHTISISDKKITAQDIIIATGSEVAFPSIDGIDCAGVISSDDLLAVTEYPDSLVIVGGGVIGVEFAFILSAYQKDVTIVEMMPSLLSGFDKDIVIAVTRMLDRRGVKIVTNAKVTKFENTGKVHCHYKLAGEPLTAQADKCLIATGRTPRTKQFEGFGLSMTGKSIVVDESMRTNYKNIFAIGDVTGKIQLAHVASAQGCVTAANICGKNEKMLYDIVPSCVYTMPECACIGLTQSQAEEKGYEIRIGMFPAAANGKCMIEGYSEGFVKIISDGRTGEILGAHFFAPRATDMIGEVASLMRSEGTVEELMDTIHPHPTESEMIMEAAEDVHNISCHL